LKKGMSAAVGLEIEVEGGLREVVTPYAGTGLLVEAARRSGTIAVADRVLPGKKNPKGLSQGQMVESVVVLSALGGECSDDFEPLRKDDGLATILGYRVPAPSTVRDWLEQHHDEAAMAERPEQGSFIPRESNRLAGLAEVRNQIARAYVSAAKPDRKVTLDVDAHLVESTKKEALDTYKHFRGYQPMLVTWAQTRLILSDQFRDGNVPASKDTIEVVDDAYAALPSRPDGWEVRVRSDSAAYEHRVLDHWADRKWTFAVSADMSQQLKAEIDRIGIDEWQPWAVEKGGFVREWAEVTYVPSRSVEKRDVEPYRYLCIRIRSPQGVLFSDGAGVRLFAVVTNDWQMNGRELLEWHRGKAGTVEHSHRTLKDELAAGVYPSGKFGANAAWLRLQVITANLLELLKATALDEKYRNARPKRLRFAIFNQVGRLIHHARKTLLRVVKSVFDGIYGPGLRRLRLSGWPAS
jgi:hypothetical protein